MICLKRSARAARVVMMCVIAAGQVHGQQLDYGRTVFIHGFGSSSSIWTTPHTALGGRTTSQYIGDRVDLGALWTPSWDAATVFTTEWQQVRDTLNSSVARIVLVGHSLGGLVGRYGYLQAGSTGRSKTAGIMTVASPHQGSLLADSAQQLGEFASELKYRVDDAAPWAEVSSTVLLAFKNLLENPGELLRHFFVNIPQFPNAAGLTQVAVLPSAKTTSGAIGDLSASFDATIPRANIVARMSPTDFMPVRLGAALTGESEQSKIDDFRKLQSAFTGCKWFFGLTLIAMSVSNKCSNAHRMLGQFDATWQRYLNGSTMQQRCGTVWFIDGPLQKCWNQVQPTLNVPSDGVVTNSRSVFPGHTTGEFWESPVVVGANHNTVHRVVSGVDQIVQGMLVGLRMRTPPPPPPPFTVSVAGPSTRSGCTSGTWTATPTGGTAPFSYQWTVEGQTFNTGTNNQLTYTNSGESASIFVRVTATDAASASATSSPFKTNISIPGAC